MPDTVKLKNRLVQCAGDFADALPMGLVNALLRVLPRKGRSHEFPRRLSHNSELVKRRDVTWKQVYAGTRSRYPPPRTLEHHYKVRRVFKNVYWEGVGVYVVKEARIVSRHGLACLHDGALLAETTINSQLKCSPVLFDVLKERAPIRVRRLEGLTLNLASAWSCVNYGHMMVDSVSRLHLIERAGYSMAEFDHIVLPAFSTHATERLLEAANVRASRRVRLERGDELLCDELVQPSHPSSTQMRYYPPWVADFLSSRLNPPASNLKRRLYIPRPSHRRGLREQAELEQFLTARGFEVVDPALRPNSIDLFAEAEMIVGPHGAGLTDVAFCRPETCVVEITAKDWLYPYYYSLASARGMSYFVFLGSSIGPDGSFSIDLRDFRELFEKAESHLCRSHGR